MHPVDGYKPQWIDCSSEKYAKQLIPAGSYVVVKRFSSKEEKRRVKAHVLDLDEPQALENHLNYIHAGTPRRTVPLEPRSLADSRYGSRRPGSTRGSAHAPAIRKSTRAT